MNGHTHLIEAGADIFVAARASNPAHQGQQFAKAVEDDRHETSEL